MVTARWCGGRVEIAGDRSETTQVWANPDGTSTAEIYSGPVRLRDATGAWVPVDLALVAARDGSVSAKAHPSGLRLSGRQADGDHDLVTLGTGDDAVTIGWRGPLPVPRLAGTRATYDEVMAGVDLVVEATRTGFEYSFVVKDRAALARLGSVSMRLRSKRAARVDPASGGLTLKGARGRPDVRLPEPLMWDARVGAQSGEHLKVGRVGMGTVPRGPDLDLELAPDPAFLADPDLRFPVTVDPSVVLGTTFTTFVQTGYTSDQSGSTELKLGYSDDGGSWTARSFLVWNAYLPVGTQVSSATVYLWEWHSWSCTPAQWEVRGTGGVSTATRWTNQPGWADLYGSSTQTKGHDSGCNDGWVSAPATGFFQNAADHGYNIPTMGLKATSETDHLGWKKFNSRNAASNIPYAVVTYNSAPAVTSQSTTPSSPCVTGSTRPYLSTATPTLGAQVSDPEGSPATATFEWWNAGGSMIGTSMTGSQASGSTFTTTVPAGAFSNGNNYSWRVRGSDATSTGAYSGFCEFTVDTSAPGTAPGVSSPTFPQNSWTGSPPGYSVSTAPGTAYVNGTSTLNLTGDDSLLQVSPPFPVSFYGQTYTTAWIETNGLVQFVDPVMPHPDDIVAIPDPALPNAAVYAFGDDLVIDDQSSVRTAVVGSAPNRRYVIEWNNATRYWDNSDRLNAEVIFNENGGDITTNYTSLDNDNEKGASALVGAETPDGTAARQYSYHNPILANNTAITFHYNTGSPPVSAGTAANFTFTASSVADVASYQYGLDENPPSTVVNAPSLGANVTVSITPTSDGPHTLYVRSQDRAGNQSPITGYQFNVGYGGLTSPHLGDISAGKVALAAVASPAVLGVTYQWRRADTDAWATIPEADVTVAAGGGPVTWPQAVSGGAFPKLNWDLAATLNNAEAGPDSLDGPVQVRAAFGGGYSTPVKIALDRNRASAASANVGPGSVNVLTGNYVVGATDVSISSYGSDLTVTRAFNTRRASDTDGANMFGSGWVSGVVVGAADAPYTRLTVTGGLAQVWSTDGDPLGFTAKTTAASGTTYDSETGFEQLMLTYATAGDLFTLRDLAGNTVTFTQVPGAAAGVYHPTAVTTPGSNQTTSLSWQKVTVGTTDVIRPTQMLAPVPAGVSCATLVKGCRALTFSYATTTTATGTAPNQWGDYTGRLSQIAFTAWDPDATPAAMRTVVTARYSYDSTGRLRAVWDPRLDWTDSSTTPPTTRHLTTGYDYDADGIVTTIHPAGGFEPWQLAYTTIPGDPGKGRLARVSRSALAAGTAQTTVVYRVPTTGAGAPYDLSAAQTTRWGQAEQPVDATAVYDPGQIPDADQTAGTLPSSYDRAALTYLDANGRAVDTVAPGGATTATWYDAYGSTVRTLTAGNRTRALDAAPSDTAAEEAAIAARESTLTMYSPDGLERREILEPEHDVALPDAILVRGRTRTVYAYDQGAPTTGGPYHLVTTTTTTVRYTGAGGTVTDVDARTTTTGYDWTLRRPVISTEDPGGLALATRTTYDAATGLVTSSTAPAGGTTTNTPATRQTVYYRSGTGSGYTECDNHPEWANLPCRVQPGGQAASGPELPVIGTTYDLYNQARVATEKTGAGVLRTTTTTYDAAGRASTVAVTGAAGTGTTVPTRRTVYDQASGQAVRTQSLDVGGTVTAEVVRQYDTLGRVASYTDADTNTSVTTYDLLSRMATSNNGRAIRTYTYDGGNERRSLATQVVDGQVGTFTGTYNADGRLGTENWPTGIVLTTGYDETGAARTVSYTRPGCGQPDCTVYTETVHESGHGQQGDHASTLSGQHYSYDRAGRLTAVNDTVAGACTTRAYVYNSASDRTALSGYAPAADGTCQTATADATTTWTYDAADRMNTPGYTYDVLGRIVSAPASDTESPGQGSLAATYHITGPARSLSQDGRTTTYTLDVDGERTRSWTDSDGTTAITRIQHYATDADDPVWTDESGGAWSRRVAGLGGLAAITTTAGPVSIDWQIINLHGDCVATVHDGDTILSTTGESTEYGVPRNVTDVGSRRYGWLGAQGRTADEPGGVIGMGVRLYNGATGRFLQVDPVSGGSANAYDYCNGDPVNCTDLDGKAPFGCYQNPRGATIRVLRSRWGTSRSGDENARGLDECQRAYRRWANRISNQLTPIIFGTFHVFNAYCGLNSWSQWGLNGLGLVKGGFGHIVGRAFWVLWGYCNLPQGLRFTLEGMDRKLVRRAF
jgi:RHS repeat-associated protein